MAPKPEMNEKDKTPEKMSKGEKVFNWLTYGGIGYVFTFIATVPIAWYLQYHHAMVPRFEKAGQWLGKRFNQDPESAKKLLQTVTLHFGGLVGIPFIWLAEKGKVPFVQHWNEKHNDTTDPAAIAEAPKQTIGTLFWARFTAWATVFVSLFGGNKIFPKSFQTFETEFAEKFCKVIDKPCHVGVSDSLWHEHTRLKGEIDYHDLRRIKPSASLLKEWHAVEKELGKHETTHFQVGRLASLDVFATAASATLLFVVSRVFAKKREKHLEKREERQEEQMLSPPAPQVPVDDTKPRAKIDATTVAAQKMAPEMLQAQL